MSISIKPFSPKDISKLSKLQLLQINASLEKFFYATGTNIAFWNAFRNAKSQSFKAKIARTLKKQVLSFAELDKVSSVTRGIGKTSDRNTAVAVGALWLAFHEEIIGGPEAVLLYLLWAGEKGGQTALDKMVPQYRFNLQNLALQAKMNDRVSFLNKVVDRTTIGWVADIINEGVKSGLSNTEIVKLLRREASQMAIERADVITETELMTAMSVVEVETYRRNGIQKHRWITSLDEKVCPICLENEDAGTVTIGEDFPSETMMPPAHIRCYDDKTEIYTNEGWKFFNDLHGKEKILSLNPDNHQLEWLPYINFIRYQYDGKMYHLTSKSLDLMVTPDHDLYAGIRIDRGKSGRKTEWRFIQAEEAVKKSEFKIPRTAKWLGKKREFIHVNGLKIDAGTFVRFMGYYLSEGSVTKRYKNCYQISISQEKKGNLEKIYDDIKNLPLKISKGKSKLYIFSEKMGRYLAQFGKSFQKFVPKDIKELSSDLIKDFLMAYCLGDGHIQNFRWEYKQLVSTRRDFSTSSKRMSDDLSELILKIGNYPYVSIDHRAGIKQQFSNGIYTINHDTYRIYENHSKNSLYINGRRVGIKIRGVKYGGYVYDIELPKNHVLWVRRNGKACFSGNCRCYLLPVLPAFIEGTIWTGA